MSSGEDGSFRSREALPYFLLSSAPPRHTGKFLPDGPTDILELDFLRGQKFNFEILRKKKCKNRINSRLICGKHKEKNRKIG